VLLGLARGDASVPGIGERKMSEIRPEERTTPAGRFASEPGRNLSGEDIVWVDYDAAVSMHRVRPTVKAERRLERLATPTAADNRITYGCINVPAAFYDAYVKPALGARHGVVYVLPETSASRSVFGFLATSGLAAFQPCELAAQALAGRFASNGQALPQKKGSGVAAAKTIEPLRYLPAVLVASSCACCRCPCTTGSILVARALRSASLAFACVFFSSFSVASWSPTPACFT
jgi:hypothetical protein